MPGDVLHSAGDDGRIRARDLRGGGDGDISYKSVVIHEFLS